MPRNQRLASVGITGCFASECPAGIRRNTQLSYPIAAPTPPNLVRTDRPPVEVVEIWFADT